MNKQSPEFQALVNRLVAGEISRKAAAAEAGINYVTLNLWLRQLKLTDQIPVNDYFKVDAAEPFKAGVKRGGLDLAVSEERASALNKAVQRVLSGEVSARAAGLEMGLSPGSIAAKVRKIRISQGLPVQARTSPGPRGPKEAAL